MKNTVSRTPLVVVLLLVVLAGGGLYKLSTATQSDDQRVVRFYAHWNPPYVRSLLIEMSSGEHPESWRDARPTFEKTRTMNKGEIARLRVSLPANEYISELKCYIKVGKEAPKWGQASTSSCRVEKYVG